MGFAEAATCVVLPRWAGLEQPAAENLTQRREAEIDRLADSMEQHLDFSRFFPPGWTR